MFISVKEVASFVFRPALLRKTAPVSRPTSQSSRRVKSAKVFSFSWDLLGSRTFMAKSRRCISSNRELILETRETHKQIRLLIFSARVFHLQRWSFSWISFKQPVRPLSLHCGGITVVLQFMLPEWYQSYSQRMCDEITPRKIWKPSDFFCIINGVWLTE